jgi:hypothetical protein
VLRSVSPPGGFVVVSQHWPGSLISVLALDVPLIGGFFADRFHRYFNPPTKHDVMQWHSTRDFCAPFSDTMIVYLLSGHADFLGALLHGVLKGCQRVIIIMEFARCRATWLMIQCTTAAGGALLWDFGLQSLVIANSAVGGATDGRHLFGFGCKLGSLVTPMVETGLPRTLRHFLDGGVEGQFASVCKDSLPLLDKPARVVVPQ